MILQQKKKKIQFYGVIFFGCTYKRTQKNSFLKKGNMGKQGREGYQGAEDLRN
jgi:hypothetical protein